MCCIQMWIIFSQDIYTVFPTNFVISIGEIWKSESLLFAWYFILCTGDVLIFLCSFMNPSQQILRTLIVGL